MFWKSNCIVKPKWTARGEKSFFFQKCCKLSLKWCIQSFLILILNSDFPHKKTLCFPVFSNRCRIFPIYPKCLEVMLSTLFFKYRKAKPEGFSLKLKRLVAQHQINPYSPHKRKKSILKVSQNSLGILLGKKNFFLLIMTPDFINNQH